MPLLSPRRFTTPSPWSRNTGFYGLASDRCKAFGKGQADHCQRFPSNSRLNAESLSRRVGRESHPPQGRKARMRTP
ncbi:hypothetical protein BN12_40025 [Nostocoides japonicum T1-X7]|uniref:Uncharacterized protein n=1 Tax=Nostocoides japonicum T1-X7 TaxID=1194083 RepID=A0A077M4K5_9MICO|nr:hypothetical protein BN12_40025 [Tetrasphaera japonica T1-X7]